MFLTSFFLAIGLAMQWGLVAGAASPSCTDTEDHFMNGSTRNNTLGAGSDLIAYFNDPARNGILSLPALGANDAYNIQRQVGMCSRNHRGCPKQFTE
jgi:hypothetical protein